MISIIAIILITGGLVYLSVIMGLTIGRELAREPEKDFLLDLLEELERRLK